MEPLEPQIDRFVSKMTQKAKKLTKKGVGIGDLCTIGRMENKGRKGRDRDRNREREIDRKRERKSILLSTHILNPGLILGCTGSVGICVYINIMPVTS